MKTSVLTPLISPTISTGYGLHLQPHIPLDQRPQEPAFLHRRRRVPPRPLLHRLRPHRPHPRQFLNQTRPTPLARYPPPAKAQATVSIINIHPQDQCRLFKLPPELRLTIYSLALASDDGIAEASPLFPPHHLALVLTSRRILAEAEHLYYATNRFTLLPSNRKVLRNIGSSRRYAIRALTLGPATASEVLDMLHELRLLPHLRSLHIRRGESVRFLDFGAWGWLAKRMRAKLGKMEVLEEDVIFTPEERQLPLRPQEEDLLVRLRGADGMLERGKGSNRQAD